MNPEEQGPSQPSRHRARRLRLRIFLAVLAASLVALLTRPLWFPFLEHVRPLDPVPAAHGEGRIERHGSHVVLHLSGSPEDMGRQHGTLMKKNIRLMLTEYIGPYLEGRHGRTLLKAAREARIALPDPIRRELDACAEAAEVDADRLLIAQCIGDLESAVIGWRPDTPDACSAYVAFGPATVGGSLEAGRNLDYDSFGDAVARRCSLVTYYTPAKGDGFRFAAVGISGVISGWTLINEHGLIIANHLGGGMASQVRAIPTLLLTRQIAQHASTVEEALDILRKAKRMRGQIIWLAQEADPAAGRPARAVAVEYDAKKIAIREAENGVLIITNENRVLNAPVLDDRLTCARYLKLRSLISARHGSLDGADPLTRHDGVANDGTQHTVQILPSKHLFKVWHRTLAGPPTQSVTYPMPGSDSR